MKRILLLALILLVFPMIASADHTIMAVSDLHLMAPQLYEGSDLLERSLIQGDGKVSHHSPELAEGLVAQALHVQPDALVVTGDLSLNGEYRSHLFVAQALQRIREAGIPVCVIPGNHDICTWIAYDYSGAQAKGAITIEAKNFANIYRDMMPGTKAPESLGFSYVYQLDHDLWLLMLDTCWYDPQEGQQVAGYVRDGLCEWIGSVLRSAQDSGARVICATHQSLFAHSSFRSAYYEVRSGEEIAGLLRQYGVKLNLSGHVHAQHIMEKNGLYDAALGGYCMSPHLYATVTVTDQGEILYEAKPVCDAHFPVGFMEMSKDFFRSALYTKLKLPDGLSTSEQEQASQLKFKLNYAYFNGTLHSVSQNLDRDPLWQLLLEKDKQQTLTAHLLQLMAETPTDMRQLRIP